MNDMLCGLKVAMCHIDTESQRFSHGNMSLITGPWPDLGNYHSPLDEAFVRAINKEAPFFQAIDESGLGLVVMYIVNFRATAKKKKAKGSRITDMPRKNGK